MTSSDKPPASPRSEAEIRSWLAERIAERIDVSPRSIDTAKPLVTLGVDSTEAVVLSGELQQWLGRRVPPTVAWDHPTIEALARYLAQPAPTRAPGDHED